MRRNIIVLDDFYSNPEEVRQIALNTPYPDPKYRIISAIINKKHYD